MSTSTLEQQDVSDAKPSAPESGEEWLWHMIAKVRSEFPNGFFYFTKDETVSDGPMVLLNIEAEDRGLQRDGSKDVIHYAKIRRADGTGEPQRVLLGELMRKPLLALPVHR